MINSNCLYSIQYNGPHEIKSTSQKGFSITIKDIIIPNEEINKKTCKDSGLVTDNKIYRKNTDD